MLSSCAVKRNKGSINTGKDVQKERQRMESRYAFFEAQKQKMLGNLKEAGAYYLKSIEMDPTNDAAYYEFSIILSVVNDLKAAESYAQKAYDIDPNNKWYQAQLITIIKAKGDLKKAVLLIEDLLKKHPDDYNSYIELNDTYLKLNLPEKALNTLERFEEKFGYSDALMSEKNRIHIARGDYASARLEVQKLIKMDPENMSNFIILADLYAEDNQLEKAFDIYLDILKSDPDNGQVHLSLSDYYNLKGQNELAFEELKKAYQSEDIELDFKINILIKYISLKDPTNEEKKHTYELINILLQNDPDNIRIHTLYSDILVKDKQYEEAQKELESIVIKSPENYLVWEQILFVDNQLGDYTKLNDHAVKMLEYFPNKAYAYFFAGLSSYQIYQYKNAVDYATEGLNYALDDTLLRSQFYAILGDAYHRLNDSKASDEAFDASLKLNPNNNYILNNYAYFLALRSEDLDKAEKMITTCVELAPNNWNYFDTYAWVMFKKKHYKKALELIEQAYEQGGKESPVVVEHYGDILFFNAQTTDALNKWKEAMSKGKGSDVLEEKIKQEKWIEE